MKTTKRILMLLVITSISTIIGCAKDGKDGLPGPAGPKGETGASGPNAKYYDFTLTFGTSVTSQTYNMPSMSMYDKVTFVYLDKGYKDWVMLPYYENSPGYVPVNYVAVCDEILERITVRTDRGDNQTGSPWASNNVQRSFRAVVIETSAKLTNPNIDYSNYEEVNKFFKLEE